MVAAIHAGWKGAINEIIRSTIHEMEKIGSTKQNIIAIIGPTIQKKSYEIGSEVNELIMQTDVFKKNKDVICCNEIGPKMKENVRRIMLYYAPTHFCKNM